VLDARRYMGLGIRAGDNIKKGMWLGAYTGEIKAGDKCEDTGYLASLDWPPRAPRESQFVVDAAAVGNVRNSYSAPTCIVVCIGRYSPIYYFCMSKALGISPPERPVSAANQRHSERT
jgi:hypothetical protein